MNHIKEQNHHLDPFSLSLGLKPLLDLSVSYECACASSYLFLPITV